MKNVSSSFDFGSVLNASLQVRAASGCRAVRPGTVSEPGCGAVCLQTLAEASLSGGKKEGGGRNHRTQTHHGKTSNGHQNASARVQQ